MKTTLDINTRIKEIRAEIKTLEDSKKAKPLSSYDAQDISDAYQERLEINWALSDLYYELDHLTEPNESDNIQEEDTFYIS